MSSKKLVTKHLLIGGNGFVGRNLTQHLLEDSSLDGKILVIDNLLSSDRDQVIQDERVDFLEEDAGLESTFNTLPSTIENIYLLNCLHGNQSSLHNPILDLDNSLRPIITTLEWVRRRNPEAKVVYAGAGCAVAEKTWDTPEAVTETDRVSLDHDSPYSISKLTGEMHCILYAKQFNLDIRRARFQNVYGPGERLGAGKWRGTSATIWRNVIPTFIWKALNNEEIEITGSNASRDFIYVKDLTEGILKINKHGRKSKVYNLASGREVNILSLAELVVRLTKSKSKIRILKPRSWDSSGRRFADTQLTIQDLSFSAGMDIKQGLLETINWMLEQRDSIARAIELHSRYNLDK